MAIMGAGGARRRQGNASSMAPMNGGDILSGAFPKRSKRRKGRQEMTTENRDERGENVGLSKGSTLVLYNG